MQGSKSYHYALTTKVCTYVTKQNKTQQNKTNKQNKINLR
jgi:hypothetical protein